MSVASRIPQSASALKVLTASLLAQLSEQTHQVETQAAQLEAQTAQLATQSGQIETQITQLKHQSIYIDKLKFELARLKRWRFGAASEVVGSEQIALWEAELDGDIAAAEARLGQLAGAPVAPETTLPQGPAAAPKAQPKRKPLPDWLPRVEVRHELASCTCPACGSGLTPMGEEVSEQLDIIPAQFFVRRNIRPKYSCRHCETVHTAPMPTQPIERGLAAPALLAHVLGSKYLDHLPLHRQEQIYARDGVVLPRSTMAGWLGQLEVLFEPLVERLATHVLAGPVVHADETPGTGATAGQWAHRDRLSVGIPYWSVASDTGGGVRLRDEPRPGDARALPPGLSGDIAGRWLCRLQRGAAPRRGDRSRLHGPRETKVRRGVGEHQVASRADGDRGDRPPLRD